MCKETLKKRFIITLLALPILFLLISNVSAHTISVPTNAYFGLPEYSTYISFNPATTLGTAYRENNYWYFDGYGFQVQNANITITNFFQTNKLKFTLKASTGTSTTKIYLKNVKVPSTVTAISGTITSWNFNDTASLLTIVAQHSSDVIVEATFYPMFEVHTSSAPSATIVYGTGFNLYFPATTKLAFQHLSSQYAAKGVTVTLTVTSGTLNGTSGTLTMYQTGGRLTFISQNASRISLSSTSNSTTFRINGEPTSSASITLGSSCTVEWSFLEPVFLLPIMFILGMFGLGSMFGGPIYGIYQVKHGEYFEGFRTGLVVTVLGLALTIAWLWSSA